jgi:hypothetical protein
MAVENTFGLAPPTESVVAELIYDVPVVLSPIEVAAGILA